MKNNRNDKKEINKGREEGDRKRNKANEEGISEGRVRKREKGVK